MRNVSASLPQQINEAHRGLSEPSVSERIRTLAAQGLRVRDISSLLHVHPEIVRRVLEAKAHA